MAVLVQLSLPNYWVGSSIPDSSIDVPLNKTIQFLSGWITFKKPLYKYVQTLLTFLFPYLHQFPLQPHRSPSLVFSPQPRKSWGNNTHPLRMSHARQSPPLAWTKSKLDRFRFLTWRDCCFPISQHHLTTSANTGVELSWQFWNTLISAQLFFFPLLLTLTGCENKCSLEECSHR